jgi:glycosyltransferase involved in cell wall biosynthesis
VSIPTVTVVIPVRERPDLILDAVRSALDQTIPADKVIVVDDASADETPDVVAAIDDSRVHLIRRDRPGGGSASRNSGMQVAEGEVIGFLDSDDMWHPRRLELGLRHLDASSVGLSCCSFMALRNGKNTTGIPGIVRNPAPGRLIRLQGGPLSASVFLMRRDVVEAGVRFDEGLPALQDLDFAIATERTGFPVGGVKDVLVLKRRTDSRTHVFNPESEFAARTLLLKKYEASMSSDTHALRAHRRALAIAAIRLNRDDRSEWKELLNEAVAPLRLPEWVGDRIDSRLAWRLVRTLSHLADPRPGAVVDGLRDWLQRRVELARDADR